MKNVFFYTLLLVILNSILIVNQSLGINVILFTLPLLIFLYNYLKINKLIKNKKGLLFFIPIIILSGTYFVYDNVFNNINRVIIPILYALMFIYTVSETNQVLMLLKRLLFVFLKPMEYLANTIKSSFRYFDSKAKLTAETKKKIKAVLITIPIIIVVIWLLCVADEAFAGLFQGIIDLLKNISFKNIIHRIIIIIILFIYLNATLMFVLNELGKEEKHTSKKIDYFTMKVLLTALNIIYVVFDIVQIRSLFLHVVADSINYAQYARSGFFELMIISVINFVIILLAKKSYSKEDKYNKSMSVVMVLLTLIIIVSSFYRMNMYEQAYGYTLLRLGVYVSLITEGILLIPTIAYILKEKFNILNYYVVIVTIIYTFINLFSVDAIIAIRNIDRYNKKDDIDLDYLCNDYSDNIQLLVEFKDYLKDDEQKAELDYYLGSYADKNEKDNFLAYNISRSKALKLLSDSTFDSEEYNDTESTHFEIKLYDNSSTGYKWEYKVSNKGIVYLYSRNDYSNCPKYVVGCGGTKIFDVDSSRPGHTRINFDYVSPQGTVEKTIVYDIVVDKNYEIHERHKEV